MRFPVVRIVAALLPLALVTLLSGVSMSAEQSSFMGTALSGGEQPVHCFAGAAEGEGMGLRSVPVAGRTLCAATPGFRKTKVHARRLSAQCLFAGIARVAEVRRDEFPVGAALLPPVKGPQRDKAPLKARSPPYL